jgi:tetratricopeptide (TPR) repeat protein
MKVRSVLTGTVLGLGLLWAAPAGPVAAQVVRPQELNVQYNRAETAWKSGASVLEAKARVDRVLKELPDDVEARKLRAQVLLALDRAPEALADARRAVELAPDDGEAHLILSEVARVAGETVLARQALDAAAERVLDDATFHIRLSWNAALLGLLDRAEAFARIALALDPQGASAYYQLARVFIHKAQMDDAAAILARGLRAAVLDPAAIEKDTVLVRIAGHESLHDLMRR